MKKDTKIAERSLTFYLSLTTRKAQVKYDYTLHKVFNNFNYRQIILNKHLSLENFITFLGSVTLIGQ